MELFIFLRFPFAPNELCKALGNCPARISCFLFRAAKTWENMLASEGAEEAEGAWQEAEGLANHPEMRTSRTTATKKVN